MPRLTQPCLTRVLPALVTPILTSLLLAATPPGPRIHFAELSHDFGKLDVGAIAKHDFVYTNTGTSLLEITDVRPGCGCTTAGAWDKTVEPGQTGRIPLQFNSTGFGGTVAKSATVTCNDVTRSNVVLQIRGTVWRPIDITPATAYFSVSSEGPTNETRIVRIVNNLDGPLELSQPQCTNEAFRVELETVKPGREFALRVTVQPPLASSFVQASVTLKTSVTNPPLLTIPAYASVQPAIQVSPSQIVLASGPSSAAIRPGVTIRNAGTNVLVLSDAAVSFEGAEVQIKELQPGRLFGVTLVLPEGTTLPPGRKVEVTLKSNHPRFPVITVPVLPGQPAAAAVRAATKPASVPTRSAPVVVRPTTVPTVTR